ncbi:hypothetical protein L596_030243 [Steinernema carpocapsae]|uniref:Serine aminopeptidase S33 domain-containing protein n=1 Tax=Steinernema carpocapsae TaxID=34508 RepID=A0A4U5LS55_STECR|nr:hypothetical protein L596_030243 [Steinernema carpocapsae]
MTDAQGDVILVTNGVSNCNIIRTSSLIEALGDTLSEFSLASDWNPSLILRTLPEHSVDRSNVSTISMGVAISAGGDAVGVTELAPKEIEERSQGSEVSQGFFHRMFSSFFSFVKCSTSHISEVVVWTGKVIYVLCPPVPAIMIRKVAFQPPPKGKFYYLLPRAELVKDKRPTKRLISLADYDSNDVPLVFVFPYLGRNAIDPDYPTSREQIARLQPHVFKSGSGNRLIGCEIRCARSTALFMRSPKILLFAQPNSSDIGSCMMTDPNLVDICDFLNCDMFGFDYSGFGMSEGRPTESTVYRDIESAFAYVCQTFGYTPEDVIPLGFSMGTATSIHLASTVPEIKAMILIAPFTSVLRVVVRSPTLERTPGIDKFRSVEKVDKVEAFTLVCHGTKDYIVPLSHGEYIYEKLKNKASPLWVEDASHQGIYCDRNLWIRINEFLNDELNLKMAWEDSA